MLANDGLTLVSVRRKFGEGACIGDGSLASSKVLTVLELLQLWSLVRELVEVS